jgi:hypothetical protein
VSGSSAPAVTRRDPLLAFVALTAALIALQLLVTGVPPTPTDTGERAAIEVTDATLAMLEQRVATTFGRAATPDELAREVDAWLREELLVREARRLQLDLADPTIRTHLASQMVFLLEAWESPPVPSDAALRAFYEAEAEWFTRAARVTVRQWQIAADAPGATETAAAAEAVLRDGGIPPQAATPIGGPVLRARRTEALREQYGPAFATLAEQTAVGEVVRLVDSERITLLRVEERFDAVQVPFEDARDRVAMRWQQREIQRATNDAVEQLRAATPVVGWPR